MVAVFSGCIKEASDQQTDKTKLEVQVLCVKGITTVVL